MKLKFCKMHGLGNDFMVVETLSRELELTPERIRAWADRNTGIGFDQFLELGVPTDPEADFWYRIYNADGTQAEQCGNGARCMAKFARHMGLTSRDALTLQTSTGTIQVKLVRDDVEVNMGVPILEHARIPFIRGECDSTDALVFTLQTDAGAFEVTPVSVGNPHGVLFVDNVQNAPVPEVGAALTAHPQFPAKANIGFCQVVDEGFLRLRVFERGVGETRACGTGACAAAIAARLHGLIGERVKISLPGGKLRTQWHGPGTPLTMTGPAELVYEGMLEL